MPHEHKTASDTAPHHVATRRAPRLIRHLSIMTLIEGSSLIALVLIAVPLKHLAGLPIAVEVVGPIHGTLFLWMVATLLSTMATGQISPGKGGLVFLAALIPFGGLWSHRLIDRDIARHRTGAPTP